MKNLLMLLVPFILVGLACKKEKKNSSTTTTVEVPVPPATEYRKIKNIRTQDTITGYIFIRNTLYSYNSLGQPIHASLTDSTMMGPGTFTVSHSITNYYYESSGKMTKIEYVSGNVTYAQNYLYD